MKVFGFVTCLLGLVLATFVKGSVDDKECGSNLCHLWLDIIFVVDNAAGSKTGQVLDVINALFPPGIQIGTAYDDPRSTRIGIIYSGNTATVMTDWYKLESFDDLNVEIQRLKTIRNDGAQYQKLENALNLTGKMLEDTNGIRDNYKKLVVVFTNNFVGSSVDQNLAADMRNKGTTIATVNMYSSNIDAFLRTIASYGMNFNFTDPLLERQLQTALLSVNCHCPPGLSQYYAPTPIGNHPYAICVTSTFEKNSWHAAQQYCHRQGQYLVTEFTTQKREFNMNFMNRNQEVNGYFSGLFYNGTWMWDQRTGQPYLPLDPSSGSVSSRSGCVADIKYADGSVAWTPISCSSTFPFICETTACDTENYCSL